MATNPYFRQGIPTEQVLYEDLIIESIKMHGQDVWYIPKTLIHIDDILNEETLSKFDDAYKIEMYLQSVDSYEGDGKLMSKFGLEIRDQVVLVCAKRRWIQAVGDNILEKNRPTEGDLIYLPLVKGLFEIKFSDAEKVFYQLKQLPVYHLTCELFEYNHQQFTTDVEEIDDVQTKAATTVQVAIQTPDNFDTLFEVLEPVDVILPNSIPGEAVVLKITVDGAFTYISLGHIDFADGRFHNIPSGTIVSSTDGEKTFTTTGKIELNTPGKTVFENDKAAQNSVFERRSNDIVSFDESNPFGEINTL